MNCFGKEGSANVRGETGCKGAKKKLGARRTEARPGRKQINRIKGPVQNWQGSRMTRSLKLIKKKKVERNTGIGAK